jgi:elongator complex protein 1
LLIDSKNILFPQEVVIGLTEHSRLYVNDKEIANNCSSFFVHDEYLLLTTTSHVLRCLSILPDGKGKGMVLYEVHLFGN